MNDDEAFCTQAQYNAVEQAHETLDSCAMMALKKAMPSELAEKIADLADELHAWLDLAEEEGIEPDRNDREPTDE